MKKIEGTVEIVGVDSRSVERRRQLRSVAEKLGGTTAVLRRRRYSNSPLETALVVTFPDVVVANVFKEWAGHALNANDHASHLDVEQQFAHVSISPCAGIDIRGIRFVDEPVCRRCERPGSECACAPAGDFE